MRTLMWFAIGFTTACTAGVYLVSGNWLLIVAAFCFLALVGLLMVRTKWSKVTVIALLGCVIGLCWLWGFDHWYLSAAKAADGDTQDLSITVTDYSYETAYGVGADGKVELDGKAYNVRFYRNDKQPLKPGDTLSGEFQLRYTGASDEQVATYHSGKGIFLLAYPEDEIELVPCDTIPARYFPAALRSYITGILDRVFPADTLAFARALLLGDSSLMTYDMDTAFSVSGIRHIIAVSGLHVSILFSLMYVFSGKNRALTALIGIPVLLIFAAVAGFTPSIVRACLMQVLMILAMLFNKEYDPPTALSFAVLVLLAVNPITITSVSFQLSVGCMIGIFLFSRRIHDYLLDDKRFGPAKGKSLQARLTRWVVGSVSVTLSAMVVTTPLCAIYFEMVSLVGVLTNLLTLWMVSVIFYGIMAACILGALWLPLGVAVAWIIAWPMRAIQYLAAALSRLPLAAVYTDSVYIVIWLVVCYVLLAVFFFSKQKHLLLLAGCMGICLCLAIAASAVEPWLDNYRVTVLDVGQGQSILLQTDGRTYLVDCGGDSEEEAADTAASMLLSQCIYKLDGLILTHYDDDHAGGVPLLLTRIEADKLYLPDIDPENPLRKTLETGNTPIQWIPADTVGYLSQAPITLLSTVPARSGNENSLCVLFQPENCDILITGDRGTSGEKALLDKMQLPELELLVVGHHGAKSAACLELLKATDPAMAVISVGENSYGHPSAAVLNRLELFDCPVKRTDLEGTIIFRG